MGHPQSHSALDATGYLEWEARQQSKNEYLHGEILAMVSARKAHVVVAMNVAFTLRQHLQGTACQVFLSDMKVRIETADAFFYPDVVVTCDARDAGSEDQFIEFPKVVVEVLSDSTAAFDFGAKFDAYRLIETLEEYVLIDPDRMTAYAYHRGDDGRWVLHDAPAGQPLRLKSVGLDVPHAELFAGVRAASSPNG